MLLAALNSNDENTEIYVT